MVITAVSDLREGCLAARSKGVVANGVGREFAAGLEEWEVAGKGPANSKFGSCGVSVDALERH